MEDAEDADEELEDETEEEEDTASEGLTSDDEANEASLEELLAKRAKKSEEEDPEAIFDLTREDKPTSVAVRTIPKKSGEFVCSNCRLVKSNSQLADAKRKLCNDCV